MRGVRSIYELAELDGEVKVHVSLLFTRIRIQLI